MALPILTPTHHWHCPACGAEDVTHEAEPHTRFHSCAKLGGFSAPMAAGRKGDAKVVVHEREDYIGHEDVQLLDGRPIMNITTHYADGHTDVAVYAPTAHAGGTA